VSIDLQGGCRVGVQLLNSVPKGITETILFHDGQKVVVRDVVKGFREIQGKYAFQCVSLPKALSFLEGLLLHHKCCGSHKIDMGVE
jgi:hypothetical protein